MKLLQTTNATALTIYAIVKKKWDTKYWDVSSGAFETEPTTPFIEFAEDSVIKGFYEASIATNWENGRYLVAVYKQAGASPSPVADGEPDVAEIEVLKNYIYVR